MDSLSYSEHGDLPQWKREVIPTMKTWHVPKDVAAHPVVKWYRDRAETHGGMAAECTASDHDADAAYEFAREAAHYAGLVIGYEEQAGRDLCMFEMDVRVATAAPVR